MSVTRAGGPLERALLDDLETALRHIVDEVACLAYGNDAANVLFHVVDERHIRRPSMIFTTNKNPSRWRTVLHDDGLAEVIVDRVLERGRLLKLDGPSIRTKHLADDPTSNDDQDNNERLRISGTNGSKFPEPTPSERNRARSATISKVRVDVDAAPVRCARAKNASTSGRSTRRESPFGRSASARAAPSETGGRGHATSPT
jgi:hypothetical protein